MSRPSLVSVLAEDERHQRFIRKYLYRLGLSRHEIRMQALPNGRGCGEQWVRERYTAEVKAYRQRSAGARAKTWLIVAIDADMLPFEHRVRQLKEALRADNLTERGEAEAIVHLTPKRNIETWILCLNGTPVDEGSDYTQNPGINEMITAAAHALFTLTRADAPGPPDCGRSLPAAIEELKRLR